MEAAALEKRLADLEIAYTEDVKDERSRRDEAQRALVAARDRIEQLELALKEFGHHLEYCVAWCPGTEDHGSHPVYGVECDCGYDIALHGPNKNARA